MKMHVVDFARTPAFRLLQPLMIAASVLLAHPVDAADSDNPAADASPPAPETEACSGVQLSLADCLGLVAQIGRFLDTATAPRKAAPADVAETVCEQANAPGAACLDTVARMRDWTDATFGSSVPPRAKKQGHDRSIGKDAPQWRAPTVGAYERR